MGNDYINNVLGMNENNNEETLKKVEKIYNTNFYDEGSNKYNPSTVLKNLGMYDTSKSQQKTNFLSDVNLGGYQPSAYGKAKEEELRKRLYEITSYAQIQNKTFEKEARERWNQKLENVLKQDYVPQTNYNNTLNKSTVQETSYNNSQAVNFNSNADENSLGSLDVTTELPKLSTNQIRDIISTHFSKSTVITPSDAEGIYNAQQNTGMSALAILGIGALESGYGTSNIAKKKGNIWGWGATNKNPMGNAKTFSQMSTGAGEFANDYLKTYYNGYGAKTINSAGTGDNPSKMGYAYNDDGTIETAWATNVSSIMKKFYRTAKKSIPDTQSATQNTVQKSSDLAGKVGQKIADVSNYNNSAAKGQCVWFVRGRMNQRLGKDTGSLGNANQMWYNAKDSAKLSASAENIKPNTIASYKTGLSEAGKKYGHVLYIEDVVGDTVYYTEGGSYYYNNGTIGTLKTASKKEILNGSSKFGYGLIGFIDAANY